MNASPIPTLSAAALLARDLPEGCDVLAPLMPRGGCALVYGPDGIGKTFFALGVACAAASGGSFLGWQAPRPHRVVYVDGALGMAGLRERLALLGPPPPGLSLVLPDLDRCGPGLDLARYDDQVRLLESWGRPELVVFGAVATLCAGGGGERWDRLREFLLHQRRFGRAVLAVDRANREGTVRGSLRRDDLFDVVVGLRKPDEGRPAGGARFEVHVERASRLAADLARPVLAELVPGPDGRAAWRWEPLASDRLDRAVQLLKRGLSAEAMGRALGISRSLAFLLQQRARAQGLVPGPTAQRSVP
jgi:hypothetical protein